MKLKVYFEHNIVNIPNNITLNLKFLKTYKELICIKLGYWLISNAIFVDRFDRR